MIIAPPFSQITSAKRIVSLVPSQTELLASLGACAQTVGITKFCIHPTEWFRTKQRVGGTKTVDFKKIAALAPDLILCNREENTKEQVELLAKHFPVYISDISNYDDALRMISDVGILIGAESEAKKLVSDIKFRFEQFVTTRERLSALYLIWRDPLMAAGGDTFISSMMEKSGFDNVLKDVKRYPELSPDDIKRFSPQVLLLSSEPYPFKAKHRGIFADLLPETTVILADGEMFSWYGSSMLRAPAYFATLKALAERAS